MTECHFCHKKIETMPYKCNWCGKTYCSKHHLPENHNCSRKKNNSRIKKNPIPPIYYPPNSPPQYTSFNPKNPPSKNLKLLLIILIGLILIAIFYSFFYTPGSLQYSVTSTPSNKQELTAFQEIKKEYFAPDGTKALVVGETGLFDDQGIANDGRKVLSVTLKSVQKVPGDSITYSRKKAFSNPIINDVAEPYDEYLERNFYFFILKFDIKNIGDNQIRWKQFSMTRGFVIDSYGGEYVSNIFYDIDDLEPGGVLSVECLTGMVPKNVVTKDIFFKWRIYHGVSGRQTDTMNLVWHIYP